MASVMEWSPGVHGGLPWWKDGPVQDEANVQFHSSKGGKQREALFFRYDGDGGYGDDGEDDHGYTNDDDDDEYGDDTEITRISRMIQLRGTRLWSFNLT